MSSISNIELSLSGMEKGITCKIPEIKISQEKLPTGTKKLYLLLQDTSFANFTHGLHLLDFTGADVLLKDEFTILPLMPPGEQSHQYRLTVRAYDGNHNELGVGQVTQQFP